MNMADAKTLAELYIEQHLDSSWTFLWNDRETAFGMCSYRDKTIQLSSKLVKFESEDSVEQTILHEIAHALTPGTGHGAMWKAVARRLGVRKPGSSKVAADRKPEDENYLWACVFGDELVKGYYRKPNRNTIANMKTMWIRGRKAETQGKLELVPYRSFLRVKGVR